MSSLSLLPADIAADLTIAICDNYIAICDCLSSGSFPSAGVTVGAGLEDLLDAQFEEVGHLEGKG